MRICWSELEEAALLASEVCSCVWLVFGRRFCARHKLNFDSNQIECTQQSEWQWRAKPHLIDCLQATRGTISSSQRARRDINAKEASGEERCHCHIASPWLPPSTALITVMMRMLCKTCCCCTFRMLPTKDNDSPPLIQGRYLLMPNRTAVLR